MGRRGGLSRAAPTRVPKARFIIYCEGKNTERQYFVEIEALYEKRVIIVPRPVPGDPLKLATEASVRRPDLRSPRNSFEESDQVWAVFDCDQHVNFDEAIRHCERNGVRVGRSNPCFELWLILHEQNFDRQDASREVSRYLQTLNPKYDPERRKVCTWDRLAERVLAAEHRAHLQLARREQERKAYGRPSTTVGHLTEAIRNAAEKAKASRPP